MSTAEFVACFSDPSSISSIQGLARCTSSAIAQESEMAVGFMLLLSGTLVFFMQAGFCMVCAGCVRTKNLENSMLKNFLDLCGAALAYFVMGYAFAFGDGRTFIGRTNFFMMNMSPEDLLFWFFQMAFAATAATIVAGAVAERCQMIAYFVYSFVITGFLYPVVVRSIWTDYGFLARIGVIDFAGSGVVHLTGGYCALIAVAVLGPRKGRFADVRNGSALEFPRDMKGHSVPLQALGTFILWFGWFGFNCGSTLTYSGADYIFGVAYSLVNTTLAGAMAAMSALFLRLYVSERQTGEYCFDVGASLNASLAGLVAITAGASLYPPYIAVLIGAMSGALYVFSSELLVKYRIDDVVDAIPVHFFNGMFGMISVGLFAAPENLQRVYGNSDCAGLFFEWGRRKNCWRLFGVQIVAIIFILFWVTLVMGPFFAFLRYFGYFRSDALEEFIGLDASYHGRAADGDDPLIKQYYPEYRKKKSNRNDVDFETDPDTQSQGSNKLSNGGTEEAHE